MGKKDGDIKDVIHIKQQDDDAVDIHINIDKKVRSCGSVECHLVLYPYSRDVNSECFNFIPFEEYVGDILENHRSAYYKIKNHFDKGFGLFLALILVIGTLIFAPEFLLSVEVLISVIGAYIIGKELGADIENLLIDMTTDLSIKFREQYYQYRLEKSSTLTHYSGLAKKRRYGRVNLIPQQMDFIQHSNSETVRMMFFKNQLESVKEGHAHIMSVQLEEGALRELKKKGYMFGVKLSFNKHFLGMVQGYELFQSLENGSLGCLDTKGKWMDGAAFYRHTFRINRLKIFLSKGIIKNASLIKGKF